MIFVRIEIDRKWANKIKKNSGERDDKEARGFIIYILYIVSIYVFDV